MDLPWAHTSGVLLTHHPRGARVRFSHPVRIVTLEGQPRVIRTLTANVSKRGLFLRMPEPLPRGTKVALSLEAGGRALALAQAEVVWERLHTSDMPGRFPGCGVRFTEFMHPRAEELVEYLLNNLDQGKPLRLAPPVRRRLKAWAGTIIATATLGIAAVVGAPMMQKYRAQQTLPVPKLDAPLAAVVMEPAPIPVAAPAVVPPPPPVEVAVAVAAAVVEPEPVPVPVPVAAAEPPPPVVAQTVGAPGVLALPTGAAARLIWVKNGRTLRLAPEATVSRAFVLSNPPRAVFDLEGGSGTKSLELSDVDVPHTVRVRLGPQGELTRLVLDLETRPKKNERDGDALVLSF